MSLLMYALERSAITVSRLRQADLGEAVDEPPPPYAEEDVCQYTGSGLPLAYVSLIARHKVDRAIALLKIVLSNRRRSKRERCHCIEHTLSFFLDPPREAQQ
jgi:hypothetical protein